MKIAIINQRASTGGWKYVYYLVKAIMELDSSHEITIFYSNIESSLDISLSKLKKSGIKFEKMPRLNVGYKKAFKNKFINDIYNYQRSHIKTKKAKRLFNPERFDLIHYAWPYFIEPLKVDLPCFFIPHDFTYSHYIGGNIYTKDEACKLKDYHKDFLEVATPIVSTPFIAKELKQLFVNYKKDVNVVFLSSFNDFEKVNNSKVSETLKKFGISGEYILCSNNLTYHKNLGQVLGAYYWVKQKHPNVKLVITGYGTKGINGVSNSPHYIDWLYDQSECDVISLGQINDDEFYTIMQGAKMVVNASLIEAGNGSGLDAWRLGVPVVMSDIPSFNDQLDFLNVKAELFDPRNAKDIARAINYLLENPQIAEEYVKISKEAMEKYTWSEVAKKYLEIFKRGIDEYKK